MHERSISIFVITLFETIQDKTIELRYCPTDKMLADLLTKPLSRGKVETLRKSMGMETFETVH